MSNARNMERIQLTNYCNFACFDSRLCFYTYMVVKTSSHNKTTQRGHRVNFTYFVKQTATKFNKDFAKK